LDALLILCVLTSLALTPLAPPATERAFAASIPSVPIEPWWPGLEIKSLPRVAAITSALQDPQAVMLLTGKTYTETITATAQELTGTGEVDITMLAGPPTTTTSSLVASPDTIRADGVSTSQLTAKVRDAGDNFVPNAFVGFTTNLGTTSHAFAEAEDGSVPQNPGGAWGTKSDIPDASGGSYIEVNATGYPTATVSWSFAGGAFRLRYRAAPDSAIALIQIDSTPITVDTYAATAQWIDFTRLGLSPGHY
jgi:hypothetical protein